MCVRQELPVIRTGRPELGIGSHYGGMKRASYVVVEESHAEQHSKRDLMRHPHCLHYKQSFPSSRQRAVTSPHETMENDFFQCRFYLLIDFYLFSPTPTLDSTY